MNLENERLVSLAEYDTDWADTFECESSAIRTRLHPESFTGIYHIGSTAIPGLAARPVVDILVGVILPDCVASSLADAGYAHVESAPEYELFFKSGNPQVQMFAATIGSRFMDSVLFRDHLRQYPVIVQRYEMLKRELLDRNPDNLQAYSEGKVRFFDEITERAKLGRQFPIVVVDYDPHWVDLYEQEAGALRALFGCDVLIRLEHFGSTAVPGLAAKPIIDILAEITSFEAAKETMLPVLEDRGYYYSWQSRPEPGHMALWKGYIPDVPVKYHLHMAPPNHPLMDRLLFRDYLRGHTEVARQYEELKRELAQTYRNDREEYTDAKSEFVKRITDIARSLQ